VKNLSNALMPPAEAPKAAIRQSSIVPPYCEERWGLSDWPFVALAHLVAHHRFSKDPTCIYTPVGLN
ncbi:MAG: hypothetical protein WAM39_04005, partial [Bryobacteraceae bacterium]